MKKAFLDCGAWTGDSVLAFKKYFPKSESFDIYAFECHPGLKKDLTTLSKAYEFNFVDKAVWVRDGLIDMYLGANNLTQSSSLLSSKRKFIRRKPTPVKALDFSKWVSKNFSRSDYVVCKMNIEGAEYDILEKMLDENSIDAIDVLYVAWHYKKLTGFPESRHYNLINELRQRVYVYTWNYEENKKRSPF